MDRHRLSEYSNRTKALNVRCSLSVAMIFIPICWAFVLERCVCRSHHHRVASPASALLSWFWESSQNHRRHGGGVMIWPRTGSSVDLLNRHCCDGRPLRNSALTDPNDLHLVSPPASRPVLQLQGHGQSPAAGAVGFLQAQRDGRSPGLRDIEAGGVNGRNPGARRPDRGESVLQDGGRAVRRLQVMETVRAEEAALSFHLSAVSQLSVSRQQSHIFKCDSTFSVSLVFTDALLNCALRPDRILLKALTLRLRVLSLSSLCSSQVAGFDGLVL